MYCACASRFYVPLTTKTLGNTKTKTQLYSASQFRIYFWCVYSFINEEKPNDINLYYHVPEF